MKLSDQKSGLDWGWTTPLENRRSLILRHLYKRVCNQSGTTIIELSPSRPVTDRKRSIQRVGQTMMDAVSIAEGWQSTGRFLESTTSLLSKRCLKLSQRGINSSVNITMKTLALTVGGFTCPLILLGRTVGRSSKRLERTVRQFMNHWI